MACPHPRARVVGAWSATLKDQSPGASNQAIFMLWAMTPDARDSYKRSGYDLSRLPENGYDNPVGIANFATRLNFYLPSALYKVRMAGM